jgi:hypothetical protein
MADAGVIDLDTSAMIEKRGHGHPRGSKNKPKDISMVASSFAVPMKRRRGRPLGSKNKPKPSSSVACQVVDANAAPRNATPPPPVNIFSLFVIVGAQCREQQRVLLKFTQFMDGRELREAILREESGGVLRTRWRCTMMAAARCILGVASLSLQRIMTCIKSSSCFSITTMARQSLT